MRKVALFVLIGFFGFVLFCKFFLGDELTETYDYMGVFEKVFGVFQWIGEKIKAVFDGMKNVSDWWSSLFGA